MERGDAGSVTLHPRDILLPGIGNDGRAAATRAPDVDAVQLHEPHRLVAAQLVRCRAVQAAAHEREVRVGVAGLDGALLLRQLRARQLVVLVVAVVGVGRKQLQEHLQVVLNVGAVVLQHLRQALVQVAGRGVVGNVEGLGIAREVGPELLAQLAAHVDQVDPRRRLDPQRRMERTLTGVGMSIDQNHLRIPLHIRYTIGRAHSGPSLAARHYAGQHGQAGLDGTMLLVASWARPAAGARTCDPAAVATVAEAIPAGGARGLLPAAGVRRLAGGAPVTGEDLIVAQVHRAVDADGVGAGHLETLERLTVRTG